MSDRPIPFSAPMVAALLAGTKTQTRRAINPQPDWPEDGVVRTEITGPLLWPIGAHGGNCGPPVSSPKIKVGDRLYVRESYYQLGHWEPVEGKRSKGGRQKWAFTPDANQILFDAPAGETVRLGRHHKDPSTVAWHKRLGRFMPKQYSRITLIVTNVRVERLQDISEEDAVSEGVEYVTTTSSGDFFRNYENPVCPLMAYGAYRSLWNHINGPGAWDANPWVVAYTFTIHRGNIDQIGGKAFPIDAVMSTVTGILVCEDGIGCVYEVLNWMTGECVYTHQIPRISREAQHVLLGLHPEMQAAIDEACQVNGENWRQWLATWTERYGAEIAVPVMNIAEHERIDPMSELAEHVHPDRILTINPKDIGGAV